MCFGSKVFLRACAVPNLQPPHKSSENPVCKHSHSRMTSLTHLQPPQSVSPPLGLSSVRLALISIESRFYLFIIYLYVCEKQPIFTGFWWDWLTGSCGVQSFAHMCTKMTDVSTSPHLFAEIYTCCKVLMSLILSSIWMHSPSVLEGLVHHPKALLAPLKIPYLWRETFRREVSLDVKTFWKAFPGMNYLTPRM